MGKGSYRFMAFRLYELLPNSWFYKLMDMLNRASRRRRKVKNSLERGQVPIMETGKSFGNHNPSPKSPENEISIGNRRSYYIPSGNREEELGYFTNHPKATDTHLTVAIPRKRKIKPCKKSLRTHKKLIPSSASSVKIWQEESNSVSSSKPAHETSPQNIDGLLNNEFNSSVYNLHIPLPPIVTKPLKKEISRPNLTVGNQYSKQRKILSNVGNMRRSTPQTPRIKMRLKSPKLAKKRLLEKNRLADSFIVVKSSLDPQSDFRESMLEMIFQNNLWSSKDLEELLSCYLYLNSDEYHYLIVKAFKQIWFDLTASACNTS